MSPVFISVKDRAKASVPRAIFRAIAEEALGPEYELSVAFVDAKEMQRLNTIYRDKKETTDILSFPLDASHGEIYLCLSEAARMAPGFGRDPEDFLLFLFIHGCVHLKGYDHGATMERIEARLRAKFKV